MRADRHGEYRPGNMERNGGAITLWERIKNRRKPLIIVGLLVGGLAFAAGWNPPTNTVHSFTEASNYSERRQSGCTNSGAGCHGSDDDLKDFNRYHPDTDCKTCHEYTGVGCIPCHSPQQHECAGCHDGTMEGASDCVRLSDPYPKGHYRASLHTATGTDMDQTVRSTPDGTAKASCADCHSSDLLESHTGVPEVEGSSYGPEIGCGECHNDKESGALKQVLGKWKSHRCEDCHGEKTQAPMHPTDVATSVEATGTASCGSTGAGCHDVNDLHALHPDAPATCSGSAADGEPGCHDLTIQAHAPEATGCGTGEGTCHTSYVNDEYSHKQDADVHNAGLQRSALLRDEASGVSITCGSCHANDLMVEHSRAHVPLGREVCAGCHNARSETSRVVKESWPTRDSSKACAACHAESPHGDLAKPHQAKQIAYDGTLSASGCVSGGCHATADVRILHSGIGCAVAGCHSRAGRIAGSRMTCGGTNDALACHTASDKKKHAGFEKAHITVEYNSDNVATPGSCVKSGCHASTNASEQHHDLGCSLSGCHVQGGPTGPMGCGGTDPNLSCHLSGRSFHTKNPNHHIATEYNGNNEAAPGTCSTGSGCHTSTKMVTLHANAGGCYGTAGCHVLGGPSMVTGCGGTDPDLSCHVNAMDPSTARPYHVGSHDVVEGTIKANSAGCASCHSANLMGVAPGEHNGCSCHLYGLGGIGRDSCESCHPDPMVPKPAGKHPYHVGAHDTFEAGVAGATSSACVSCHGSNLLAVGEIDLHIADAHKGCLCHAYDKNMDESNVAECVNCHSDSLAPHGFVDGESEHHADSWVAASGHNTSTFGIMGATEDFTTILKGTDGNPVTSTWKFPTVNVFWDADDDDAPADAMKGLTATSSITCEDCHTGLVANGPHGAHNNWALDPAYAADYSYAELTKNITEYPSGIKIRTTLTTATAYEDGSTMVICSKCHDLQNYSSGNTSGTPLPLMSTGSVPFYCESYDTTFTPELVSVGWSNNGWTIFLDAAANPATAEEAIDTTGAQHKIRSGYTAYTQSATGTVNVNAIGSSNTAHSSHHQDVTDGSAQCVNCHVGIPHGWKAPRLLVNSGWAGGLNAINAGQIEGDRAPYRHPALLGTSGGTTLKDPETGYDGMGMLTLPAGGPIRLTDSGFAEWDSASCEGCGTSVHVVKARDASNVRIITNTSDYMDDYVAP